MTHAALLCARLLGLLGLCCAVRLLKPSKVFFELDGLDRSPVSSLLPEDAVPGAEGSKTWFIPTIGSKSIVGDDGNGGVRACLYCADDYGRLHEDPGVRTAVYLGKRAKDSARFVALEVEEGSSLATRLLSAAAAAAPAQAVSLRSVADRLEPQHASLLALAAAFTTWHAQTRHCAKCGASTRPARMGSSRKCEDPACAKSHYPRIEPAVIMLVLSPCGEFTLLGRKEKWIRNRYSCLAGFVEACETLEQAVVRETLEESGVNVAPASVAYFASQPWPFPSSLMLGFSAVAHPTTTGDAASLPPVPFDAEEMDDVAWFSKDQVRAGLPTFVTEEDAKQARASGAPLPDLHFPGRSSLARTMLEAWVSGNLAK